MGGEDWRATNRANWDERTAIHLRSQFYDVDGWLREGRGPRPREVAALGDVAGQRLLHLQCHFGLDTLAWARAGAVVTGLDFSPVAVEAARDLAERAGLAARATFVCADVYQAAEALGHATFDVVYVSLGALCWLPHVEPWAAQVGALLAPGGRFYLHDVHPLALALDDDGFTLTHDYFEEVEPFVDDSGETYTDTDAPIAARNYSWSHGIGETVTALIHHGLVIETLTEHDWTTGGRLSWLVPAGENRQTTPPGRARIPLSFTVVARRPAARG